MAATNATHHCFICHASEDKDAVARPLAEALAERGFEVWYDEYELRLGDSLREAIEKGLATSRFGVVVLSEAFFAKRWTQFELNGLTAREIVGGDRLILPVWHGIDEAYLAEAAPSLADRFAVRSSEGVDAVATRISEVLNDQSRSVAPAAGNGPIAVPDAAPTPTTPEPVRLVEAKERVRLGYTEDERGRFAEGGGDPRGPGWLSVIVGPVTLQQDLIDPTAVQVTDLRMLEVPNVRDATLLNYYDLQPGLEGFAAEIPGGDAPPRFALRIAEDGLMEFGWALGPGLSTGDAQHDRVIPTHALAEYIHDFTLLFLRVLEHVGYDGEAVVLATVSDVEDYQLGVDQRRFFSNTRLQAQEVPGRPLRGLVRELPPELPRWLKRTMDRVFLAAGITTGAYFLAADGAFEEGA